MAADNRYKIRFCRKIKRRHPAGQTCPYGKTPLFALYYSAGLTYVTAEFTDILLYKLTNDPYQPISAALLTK
jgi:hypothetical protein